MRKFINWLIRLGRWEWKLFQVLLRLALSPVILIYRLVAGLARILFGFKSLMGAWQDSQSRRIAVKQTKKQNHREYLSAIKAEPGRFLIKPLIAFAVLILAIVLPIKFYDTVRFFQKLESKLINVTEAAVGQLNQGKAAAVGGDFKSAGNDFNQAGQNFVSAGQALAGVDGLLFQLLKMAPSDKLKMAAGAQKLILAGQLGSALAVDLSEAADVLFNQREGKNLSQVLTAFSASGQRAMIKLDQLNPVLAEINSNDLPSEYRSSFQTLKDKSAIMAASLKELLQVTEELQIFLGRDMDKRYLLVFQNNTEARASGGFMGSFAIIDFKQGQIKKMSSPGGGTYDTEGGLRQLVQAPKPLWLVNPLWHLWDCNWWPDWPMSARKIMWFYEKSDGSTVDGVISLTPTVIVNLLKVLGPIDLTAKYNVVITADNFMDTVQTIAEQKSDKTDAPKRIIGDMLSAIMDKLSKKLERQQWLDMIKVFASGLDQKDILLYLADADLQAKVGEMGWDGRIKNTDGDYLAVINTNIGGGKSDKKIIQTVTHQANVTTDGSVIDTVTIVRDHQAIRGEAFSGARNVDWLRIYTPLGSRLIASEGWRQPSVKAMETADPAWMIDPDLINENKAEIDQSTGVNIYREQDKTVFANWSMVDPGEIAVIKLVYKLPFKLTAANQYFRYTFLAQKQPGAVNSDISSALTLPADKQIVWQTPEQNTDSYYHQDVDRSWGYLIK